jgi:hypothetical protein
MKSKTKLGDKYNKLTVIEEPFLSKEFKFNHFKAKVRCECGNEFITKCTNLRTERSKSCKDCSFKKREQKKRQITQIEQIFKRLVLDRCIKNNIEVNITSEDYGRIGSLNCYYCGDTPQFTQRFKNRKYVNTEILFINGVDRLNPKKGYNLDNCVSCCTSCNYAKHILTEEEFKNKVIKIYNNLNLENYIPKE